METILLFSYGTLQEAEVQQSLFRRAVKAQPDTLEGYELSTIGLGANMYPVIWPSSNPNAFVEGLLLEVSPAELRRTDRYEGKAYQRVEVVFRSGKKGWVYVGNEEFKGRG